MGLCIIYYLVKEKDIEKAEQQNEDVLEMLYKNRCNCKHEDCECEWFIECFGTGVKSWDPTINLLKRLDKSTDQVIREVLNLRGHRWIDSPTLAIPSLNVKRVNTALIQITDDDIDKAYLNKALIEEIKSMEGYCNHQIERRELVDLELEQIREVFKQATFKNKGIGIQCE